MSNLTIEEAKALFSKLNDEANLLSSLSALLEWDMETNAPTMGSEQRGAMAAYLETKCSDIYRSQEMRDVVARLRLRSDVHPKLLAVEMNRALELTEKRQHRVFLLEGLEETLSRKQTVCGAAWDREYQDLKAGAKPSDDLMLAFKELVAIQRDAAQRLQGDAKTPYDAFLSDYEDGLTTEECDEAFSKFREGLIDIRNRIRPEFKRGARNLEMPIAEQKALGDDLAQIMKMPTDMWRVDESNHPFCTRVTPDDIRMCTRYREDDFMDGYYSTLHELGHCAYEVGMQGYDGLLRDVSAGLHESQSRLFEVFLGKSLEFMHYLGPKMGREPYELYCTVNQVKPSFIRVDADEVTYNLHIIIRYEIERALINGDIEAEEVRHVFDSKMQDYLGIRPNTAGESFFQDVHWFWGLFGYFPTYTFGNMIAAQFHDKLRAEDYYTEDLMAGRLHSFSDQMHMWLYQHANLKPTKELLAELGMDYRNPSSLLDHLKRKYT